ncbi:response regulator [Anaeromicropila herbilytica]|uniref:Transcriptional regulatory protein n=1 Tax=Anaeromicropila herbilytica TaxID=2785025 RepID=A0A7R7EMF8_9FIRM|nr:response regulator [Anaeromicropila herbilytica]BCN31497.1 two-component system response regulator DcuR [Anaeromicropila herbilytica]
MIKVIIVEDDLMVASINQQYVLNTPGTKVIGSFHNGKDALAYIEKKPVDLIILDVYMPNISGLDLLKKVREMNHPTDIIMVTAANDTNSLDIALKLGIVDYLIKPFKYERFKQAMDKFLLKNKILKCGKSFKQEMIDDLISSSVQLATLSHTTPLEKGLQDKTLNLLRNQLALNKDCYLTSEELSSLSGVSKVTIRRYMNYLIEMNEVISEVDYKTGGRPSITYKYLSD